MPGRKVSVWTVCSRRHLPIEKRLKGLALTAGCRSALECCFSEAKSKQKEVSQ